MNKFEMSEQEYARQKIEEKIVDVEKEVIVRQSSAPKIPLSPEGWKALRLIEEENLTLLL